ncbi:MAG TPA: RNA 3'-terminal phosphate cyclase [Phycisphaerae bacterium]|jgi:RNA 3'-terminal phosphate cyclase (ATP)
MLTIDGSQGEGGGQILRTSLALSLVTGTPVRIENIRARRAKPGLMQQHLTAVRAAAEVGRADVQGAAVGSRELTFTPGAIRTGDFFFAVGTAGSTTLVLQTVLPALLSAPGASAIVLEGGTHNPHAPPFDFLEKTFLPVINRMGPRVRAKLERPGFYPAGGGRFSLRIEPAPLSPVDLRERGEVRHKLARAIVANLPRHIAERELRVVAEVLGWAPDELQIEELREPPGPGNLLMLQIECDRITEVDTAFGQRGVPAESVARKAIAEVERYLAAGVPVGEHLSDQLLLPFALAGGGSFVTFPPSLHAETNSAVVKMFLPVEILWIPENENRWRVEVRS